MSSLHRIPEGEYSQSSEWGGIGKTTLARNVYENSVTLHHFDVRCWVTVSQNYNATGILSQALSCLGGGSMSTSDDQVGEELHKTLFGRRYLIVLDDLWSVDAWEMTRFYFPENSNGSRIIVTTRQQQVVNYFGSSVLALGFLDDANSWVHFCDKAFAQQGCPLELEQAGKNIVQKCRGLPLAISVIGGLLGKSPRTQEYWEIIAHDTSVILEDSGDEINKVLSILYLSYRNLPVFLKPCFIYLGLFEDDLPIQVDQLIQLWVAEGYIEPERNRSLEEVGESYVKELVDRNLLKLTNKKLKNYSVHDLVRELCLRIALQEKFYYIQGDIDGMRYPQYLTTYERPSQTETEEAPFKFKSRLLKTYVGDIHCLSRSSQLTNFRFFMSPFESWTMPIHSLPSAISLCWSLQTLVVHTCGSVAVPSEIWKMT